MSERKRYRPPPQSEFYRAMQREVDASRAEEKRISSEFDRAVRQATRENTREVCGVLYEMANCGQWTLAEGELDLLADLIRRLGKQGRRGNPGVVAADEVKAAERAIIRIAKRRLAPIRKRNNGSVPHGTIPRVVRQIIKEMIDDGRLDNQTRGKLNRKYICGALKARRKKN